MTRRGRIASMHIPKRVVSFSILIIFLTSTVMTALTIPQVAASETIVDTEVGESRFTTSPSRVYPYYWVHVHDHDTFRTRAYSNNFWYTLCGADGTGEPLYYGTWQVYLPASGNYEVFAWIPNPDAFQYDGRTYNPTQSAVYQIYHQSGVSTKTVNQRLRTGTWYSLGTFTFGPSASVILNDRTGEPYISTMIAFDAIKFVSIATPNPPYTPSNPSPYLYEPNVAITRDLSWTGGDPDPGDTVTYDVYFGLSSSPPQVSSGQFSTTYNLPTLSYVTTYYWKIVARDNHGLTTTGPLWVFTTEPQPSTPKTLTVYSSPSGVPFTANGIPHTTPWSGTYSQGTSVNLVMPSVHSAGDARYYWHQWSDGAPSSSRTILLNADTTVTATYIGPHYELTVTSSPISGVPFTVNGISKTTSYSEWLFQGYYTIEMPATYGGYSWQRWLEDADTSRTKTVLLTARVSLTAVYQSPSPDFSILASPTFVSIRQGGIWDGSTITITSINGFSQPVQLTVSGLPPKVTPHWESQRVTPPAGGSKTSNLLFSAEIDAAPGIYPLAVIGTGGTIVHDTPISLEITETAPVNYPPVCAIKLREYVNEISRIDVLRSFEIYVGDSKGDVGSAGDEGIVRVRFSSDDVRDLIPTGEWTDWYDWDSSAFPNSNWDASSKTRRWAFSTPGNKEVWAEIMDDASPGQTDKCSAQIFVNPGYAMIIAGSGMWKSTFDHCANNVYRSLRNLGFDDEHIYYLNVYSQGTEVEVDGLPTVDNILAAFLTIREKMSGLPMPFIMNYVGHGSQGKDHPELHFLEPWRDEDAISPLLLGVWLNLLPVETPKLVVLTACYSGNFITDSDSISAPNRIIITATRDGQERHAFTWVRFSDRIWGNLAKGLTVKEAFTSRADWRDNEDSWLDDNGDGAGHPPDSLGDDGSIAATTYIGVPGTMSLDLEPWQFIWKRSPGELRVYDSQNRATGLINGEVRMEIPNSLYFAEEDLVLIFPLFDKYRYEVSSEELGTYELEIGYVEGCESVVFNANSISILGNSLHQYIVDWAVLSVGGKGVTVRVDSNGDGFFEHTFASDRQLTQTEFLAGTSTVGGHSTAIGHSTKVELVLPYAAFVAILAVTFTALKLGTRRRKTLKARS